MDPTTHYLWEPPPDQCPWSVWIAFDAVDGILQDVLRAFGAVPKRGAEAGGLLLGRVEGRVVVIDGFEAVPCDYRLGPSYVFPPEDWARWQQAVDRIRAARQTEIVGFFRSDTRDEFFLAPEDEALLNQYLPGESITALLIRPFATKVSHAGFFFRSAESGFASVTALSFPFSRKMLGGGKRRTEDDAGGASTVAQLGVEEPLEPVAQVPVEQPALGQDGGESKDEKAARSRATWAAAIALSVALGWGGGFFTARSLPRLPDPAHYRLGLTAVARGTELRIAWDTASEPLKTAVRGLLRVREGVGERTIPLDLELLRLGLVVYQSPPGPVHFDFEVEQLAGTILRESIDYRPR